MKGLVLHTPGPLWAHLRADTLVARWTASHSNNATYSFIQNCCPINPQAVVVMTLRECAVQDKVTQQLPAFQKWSSQEVNSSRTVRKSVTPKECAVQDKVIKQLPGLMK